VMLQAVYDGEVNSDLGESRQELLNLIGKLADENRCGNNFGAVWSQLSALAEEMENSSVADALPWAKRLRDVVSSQDASGSDDSDDESESDGSFETPAQLLQKKYTCAGEDVTEKMLSLANLFSVVSEGAYEDEIGHVFVSDCIEFSTWAEGKGEVALSDAVTRALLDFKTIDESPLDIDEVLISIVWQAMLPVFLQLAVEEPTSNSVADVATDSRGGTAETTGSSKKSESGSKSRLVRVKEEYLDSFLEDVSKLFVSCERLKGLNSRITIDPIDKIVHELREINYTLSTQAGALQHSVVGLRRVPIRGLFSKYPRLARSLASKLEKTVDVKLFGEDVEIDKSLFEDLDGPLMHMVRNVVDHGIERPDERLARGVPESGTLSIKAEINRANVVIIVQDDGRGIDPEVLRKKALEKGLYTKEQLLEMSDADAIPLIFHPGFSTAEAISDISGRGVGLDVVRTTIREHGGDVSVESVMGQGTTFRLVFPIRQAVVVVDSLLIESEGNTFVLPFSNTREVVELDKSNLRTVQGTHVATIQNQNYTAVSLTDLFDLPRKNGTDTKNTTQGVLVGCKEGAICLMVDHILGHRKIVVNSLKEVLSGTEHFAGVSEIGGGRLALVLNAAEMVHRIERANQTV